MQGFSNNSCHNKLQCQHNFTTFWSVVNMLLTFPTTETNINSLCTDWSKSIQAWWQLILPLFYCWIWCLVEILKKHHNCNHPKNVKSTGSCIDHPWDWTPQDHEDSIIDTIITTPTQESALVAIMDLDITITTNLL